MDLRLKSLRDFDGMREHLLGKAGPIVRNQDAAIQLPLLGTALYFGR